MAEAFNFADLFIFDLANNHQGDVTHGLNIIDGIAAVSNTHTVRGAMKFQFRQLDTFLHPVLKDSKENKNLARFQSTRLSKDEYQILLDQVKKQNLITVCTPFDEESVDVIVDMDFDIIKIASCSAMDWPLIEKIAVTGKPIIFSTGGISLKQIDDLVSYFDHRGVDYAIMHCVSIYPTPSELCNLSHIEFLKSRYKDKIIGWSTHENPEDTNPVQIAVAKGARMFERHVGLETDVHKLNAYSSTPAQVDKWIEAKISAEVLCGQRIRQPSPPAEAIAIASLQRGVFTRNKIKAGEPIERSDVYFAMPWSEGQVPSGEWKNGITSKVDVGPDQALLLVNSEIPNDPESQILKTAIHEVKAMLNEAQIVLNSEFEVEYSHHYGVKNFRETGAVLITCVNREYCKKLIIQLPGQFHPFHYHDKKEETFQVLHGQLHTEIDEHTRTLNPGETVTILPGVFHNFWTDTGVIFEEISSTHYNSDSIYRDPEINKLKREERKTIVDHWGRYQI